jgi:hypothetical protein
MVVTKLNPWKEPRYLVRGKECSSAYPHSHYGDRFMARRNRVVLVTAATIATIVVLAFCLLSIWNSSGLRDASSLSWGVNEGDELVYLVVIRGYVQSVDPENVSKVVFSPPFMASMNNTLVRFNITSLPSLPLFIDGDIFAEEVLNYPETECRFENGSEIPSIFRDYINRLLYRCLLPVGDWLLLDSLYPNETKMAYYPGVYLSRTYTDSFYIGYLLWPFDGINYWGGNVSLTTGIPIIAEEISNYPSTGCYLTERLILVT